ncbi:MAG TPA: hypothetical protein PK573_14325 [Spirochaetota bacterium]|nr:hypothetical protein [Spirochaetota bacterium]HRZ27836.1 hypothetical protein [Spirochaetota bacterium]HSA13627.1 hypothetical protein [Spirochaetota bacterium]
MKIDAVNVIRVSGPGAAADALRKLEVGAELPARVVERRGRSSAVLEIGGGRIRAEFTRGLPAGDSLLLRLDGIKNESYVFKMVGAGGRADYLARLLEFSLLGQDDVKRFNPAEIGRILAGRGDALFQLHAYLLQAEGRKGKGGNAAALLSRLFSLGLGPDARADLAFFLFERALGGPFAAYIYGLFGRNRGKNREAWPEPGARNLAAQIETALDSVESGREREELIEFLAGALSDGPGPGPQSGVVPLDEDGVFVPVRYVKSGDFLALSLELSALGQLDIMARHEKGAISIMIVPDREDSGAFIRRSLPGLMESFAGSGMQAHVAVHNRNIIIDKMVEINSYFSLNSEFDVKV